PPAGAVRASAEPRQGLVARHSGIVVTPLPGIRPALMRTCVRMRWSNLEMEAEERARLPGYREEAVVRHFDAPEAIETRFYEVRAKSILNRVSDSSQAPFRWTNNPYWRCRDESRCCFCRPSRR